MTKTERYKNAVSIIRQLKKSKKIAFLGIKDMRVKDSENYQGIMALVDYNKHYEDYVLIACADKEKEQIRLDVDLFIQPNTKTYTKVLCYLLTLNLLIDYDAVFRLSKNTVHLISVISFESIKDLCALERVIICLFEIQEVYHETIMAIAKQRRLPLDNAEAYMAYQSILLNPDTLILCDKKVSITEAHEHITETFSGYRYKRFSKKAEELEAEYGNTLGHPQEESDGFEEATDSDATNKGDS